MMFTVAARTGDVGAALPNLPACDERLRHVVARANVA